MAQVQWVMESKIGPIYLVASEVGLQGILWKKQRVSLAPSLRGSSPEIKILANTVRQLKEYLDGKRKKFDIPLDIQSGTDFQKSVWNKLSLIPYGKTCSYRDIAVQLKNDRAVRAVGTANGKNPVSIIVPCHRVITSGGKLGGYAGGLDIKTKLLEIEANS